MRLKYTALDGAFKRPYADIEVRYGNESVSYVVLVDSGADINLFSAEVGEALGIDLRKGETLTVRGATGDEQTFFMHPISIVVGGSIIETTAAFADVPHLESAGIVGQRGFFNHFYITFDFGASEFELISRTKRVVKGGNLRLQAHSKHKLTPEYLNKLADSKYDD